jgi:prepilin-type processing-associated H-X9-DG protein
MKQPNGSISTIGNKRRRHRLLLAVILLGFGLLGAQLFFDAYSPDLHGRPSKIGRCAMNLRQIGLSISLYASNHNGNYPDSFGTLLADPDADVVADEFICPATDDTPAQGPTTQAIVADLTSGGHMSYNYLGRGLTTTTATSDTIVAYEPLSNHQTGINVLFGDGHVEFFYQPEAGRLLSKAASGDRPVTMPSRQ